MEHYRSNAPSPANVPSSLPPPSGMQPVLARLITESAQGNSPGDALLPPVPSFPSQSPASFVDVTSSYTHNSPTAGRSPSVPAVNPLNEAGRSPRSDFTYIGPATQAAYRSAPGLESQSTNITSIGQSTLEALQAAPGLQSQTSDITFIGDNTQQALNAAQGLAPQASISSTAQYWSSQYPLPVRPGSEVNSDGEPEVTAPEHIKVLPPVTHESVSDVEAIRESSILPLPETQVISLDRILTNPITYPAVRPNDDSFNSEEQDADVVRQGLKDLCGQLASDVPQTAIGYGAYYLKSPIMCHPDSDLPYHTEVMNHAIMAVISALDAGVGEHPTDIIFRALNAPSWPRLTMAILAAIIRGTLRSPRKMMTGSKSLNNIPDQFSTHQDITRPLTEGGAIICMAEQLAGLFDQKRNRVLKDAFDHVWEKGTKAATDLAHTRLRGLANPSNATIKEVTDTTRRHLEDKIRVDLELDMRLRSEIEAHVKEEMYTLLKNESLADIEEWRRVYREELLDAMRSAVKAPTVPIGPSSSQVLREAEDRIRLEVAERFDKAKNEFILEALADSKAGRPNTLIDEILKQEIANAVGQIRMDHAKTIEQSQTAERAKVSSEMKAWRTEYANATKLAFIDKEAAKLGYGLVAHKDAREGRPLKKANFGEKRTRSGSRSSRAPSPDPLTPPKSHFMDLEKTPTPTPQKAKATYSSKSKIVLEAPPPLLLPTLPPVFHMPIIAASEDITLSQPLYDPTMLAHPVSTGDEFPPSDPQVFTVGPPPATPDGPMDQDHHLNLENRAFEIHGKLPGVSASMHAPSQRGAPEDPPAPPASIAPPPLPIPATSDVHPSILALFNHLQTTLSSSFSTIFQRLDNQDKTITELSKPKDPRTKKMSVPSQGPKVLPALTTTPPGPRTADQPIEAPAASTPAATPMKPPPIPRNTRPQTLLPPHPPKLGWNKIATQGTFQSNNNIAQFAKSAASTQGRTTSGKRIPGRTGPQPTTHVTQVTVIRGSGIADQEKEKAVYGTPPEVIVQAARSQIERISQNNITLLHGRWSINPSSHNFVYTIAGDVPYHTIYSFRNALIGPLLKGDLVPNKGWTFAQLRNVITSDADGVIFSPDTLLSELRRNAAFSDVIFCTAPHWQASPANVANHPTSTVTMAYVDESGTHTEAAKRGGIYMFNAQVRFVPTGDHPSITQCGRCHEIGHQTDSPACPLPKNAVRCYICGKSHNGMEHAFHCQGPHKTAGKCDCNFKCLLCKGKHHARARNCPARGGFPAPTLATVGSPTTTSKKPPPPSQKDDGECLTTQRNGDFITVEPKKRIPRNQRRKNKVTAAATKANAKVPGSSAFTATNSFARIDDVPDDYSDPARNPVTPETIIFPEDPSLASIEETSQAFKALFEEPASQRETNLRLANIAWGGESDDPVCAALISLPAPYAVKNSLPLTTPQTKDIMAVGLKADEAANYITTMENIWEAKFPLQYTIEQLPPFVRFATPLDDPSSQDSAPPPIDPPPPTPISDIHRKMWVKLLISGAETLHFQSIIPAPLTEERAQFIVGYAGSSLNFDNIKQFIVDDFAISAAPTQTRTL